VQLQIIFDDTLTETYEYPSEQSLMAATPAQPGDVDYDGSDLIHSSGLLVTPSIVAAGQSHFTSLYSLLSGCIACTVHRCGLLLQILHMA